MAVEYLLNVADIYNTIEDAEKPVVIHYTPAEKGEAETPLTSELRDLDVAYGEKIEFYIEVSGCIMPPIEEDALPVTALYQGGELVNIVGSDDDVMELLGGKCQSDTE